MIICPVCSNPMGGTVCSFCSYDLSRDREVYGSLSGAKPGYVTMSVISVRARWQQENSDLLRCPTCKGTLFAYHKNTEQFRCRNCGKNAEHKLTRGLQSELEEAKLRNRELRESLSSYRKELDRLIAERETLRDTVTKLKEEQQGLLLRLKQTSSVPLLKPYRQHQFCASTPKFTLMLHLGKDGKKVVTAISDQKRTQFDPKVWDNIISIVASPEHGVGLRSDGTVVAWGNNSFGKCDVALWKDIVAISTNGPHTVGLRSDGTVVATGNNTCSQCNVSHWRNILSIATTAFCTYGLQADGRVVTTGSTTELSHWNNIVALAAGPNHLIGLRADGTVVATGSNSNGQCDVAQWKDIIAIATGEYTMGLRSDGTIAFAGNHEGLRNILSARKNATEINASGKVFSSYHPTEEDTVRIAIDKSWGDPSPFPLMSFPKRSSCNI
ncbi:MAG: hypothetical protein IKT58_00975 [Oscillospiraceae bacterium]|nr:hypothetical protein [Oscillospiraceae bacterium]